MFAADVFRALTWLYLHRILGIFPFCWRFLALIQLHLQKIMDNVLFELTAAFCKDEYKYLVLCSNGNPERTAWTGCNNISLMLNSIQQAS